MHNRPLVTVGVWSKVSNGLIVALVVLIYVLSPLPFLLGGEGGSKIAISYYLYLTPVLMGGLILLLLLKPNRVKKEIISSEEKVISPTSSIRRHVISRGAISGFISSLAVSWLILLGENLISLQPGTYFSIIGTMIGFPTLDLVNAELFAGWTLHLATGTAVGSIFGTIITTVPIFDVRNRGQIIILGIGAGFVAFIVLFNPVSRLGVEPALMEPLKMTMAGSNDIVIENTARTMMSNLLIGSIIMHLVYGVILGTMLHALTKLYFKQIRL